MTNKINADSLMIRVIFIVEFLFYLLLIKNRLHAIRPEQSMK